MLVVSVCMLAIILLTNTIFATGDTIIITGNEYDGAQDIEDKSNNTPNNIKTDTKNNTANNTTNNTTNNTAKRYNTTSVPQTGIEDYNIGILLIIAVGSSIYAYKKIRDYNSL